MAPDLRLPRLDDRIAPLIEGDYQVVQQTIRSFNWFNPTKVRFGVGELAHLREEVDAVVGESDRVFLVTGSTSLRRRGLMQKILNDLGEARVTLFDRATPFPPPALVDEALELCKAEDQGRPAHEEAMLVAHPR